MLTEAAETDFAIQQGKEVRDWLSGIAARTEHDDFAQSRLHAALVTLWQKSDQFHILADLQHEFGSVIPPTLVACLLIARKCFNASHWFFDGIYLAKSWACSGRGVYTMFAIPANTVIDLYHGRLLTPAQYGRLSKRQQVYGLEICGADGRTYIIDPTTSRSGRLRTDARMALVNEPAYGQRANCRCLPVPNQAAAQIVTARRIAPFTELSFHYGNSYERSYPVGSPA
jgi:hypothetical protein